MPVVLRTNYTTSRWHLQPFLENFHKRYRNFSHFFEIFRKYFTIPGDYSLRKLRKVLFWRNDFGARASSLYGHMTIKSNLWCTYMISRSLFPVILCVFRRLISFYSIHMQFSPRFQSLEITFYSSVN